MMKYLEIHLLMCLCLPALIISAVVMLYLATLHLGDMLRPIKHFTSPSALHAA